MELLNLKWNNHVSNILKVFIDHFSSESMVDVTLSCDGHFIKAHKIILSASSPYFQELFLNHNAKHPLIIFDGIKYKDLRNIVSFMYNGEIKVEESELTDLLAAAETLQVKGLCNIRENDDKADPQLENPENEKVSKKEKDLIGPNATKIKKRRKMSHTVNELASEAAFISQKNVSLTNSELKNSAPELKQIVPDTNVEIDHTEGNIFNSKPLPHTENTLKKLEEQKKNKQAKQETILGFKPPEKIRRPQNAFMVFANEWRRKLAFQHPGDSNTEISVRLGAFWKSLTTEEKGTYFNMAKKADEEHKIKYPGYYYSPKEARLKKNLKQDLMMARCLPAPVKDVDALRFVKVFMSEDWQSQQQAETSNKMTENSKNSNSRQKDDEKLSKEDS